MIENPHTLPEQFPEKAETLAQLASADPAFAELARDYDALSAEIYRGETNLEPMDDFRLENLKKKRLSLLDDIAERLAAA